MKAMMAGFVAVAAIGVGAHFALGTLGFSAQEVYSSENVRLE